MCGLNKICRYDPHRLFKTVSVFTCILRQKRIKTGCACVHTQMLGIHTTEKSRNLSRWFLWQQTGNSRHSDTVLTAKWQHTVERWLFLHSPGEGDPYGEEVVLRSDLWQHLKKKEVSFSSIFWSSWQVSVSIYLCHTDFPIFITAHSPSLINIWYWGCLWMWLVSTRSLAVGGNVHYSTANKPK